MATQHGPNSPLSPGAGFPWILEHLLAYPGTYELPLRTMYTLNCASMTPSQPTSPTTNLPGNAFPMATDSSMEEQLPQQQQQYLPTATAAAQLRTNLMSHITQLSSQPSSLPPAFIACFVRKCFPSELAQVDFPQALTAMDYLKDLEIRRRAEIVAAFEKLGVDKVDFADRESMSTKYPGVLSWIDEIEQKEKKIEALYSQVYVGLRRWTLINEMSLTPFNKPNCIAMLNTLYPPMMATGQFVQPTAQLTPQILSEQRNGFFRYIGATERQGPKVLKSLMQQHTKPGDENGWPNLRQSLDNYLRMASGIIDECNEITGRGSSPTSATFSFEGEDARSKHIDSSVSFSSSRTSNRSSAQSHITRPSTSSSLSTNSRRVSKEKPIGDKALPSPLPEELSTPTSPKPAGSTLERIARELRKIRSRSNVKDEGRSRPSTPVAGRDSREEANSQAEQEATEPGRGLRLRRSLKKMRSTGGLRDRSVSAPRPGSSQGQMSPTRPVPDFDAQEMKLRRLVWEQSQTKDQPN